GRAALPGAGGPRDHRFGAPPRPPRPRRYVRSSYADMMNSSDLREAGAVLAAEFLKEFAGEGPWAHLDIAGPAFLDRSRGDYLWQQGGTGYGVRLIAELASRLACASSSRWNRSSSATRFASSDASASRRSPRSSTASSASRTSSSRSLRRSG